MEFGTLDPGTVERHLEAILAIAADVANETWGRDEFMAERTDKWRLSFAAWEGGVPVAYAVMSRPAPATAHLHHFMVTRTHRGTGLGARMVAEMEARCRAAGCRRLTLKVERENEAARRFYARHGFAPAEADSDSPYLVLGKAV